ncbi:primosomal protein DnaI [Risungbinella massiliensis]|uniref:primosomal protein DnaI n=1 Tax=Risungbinella massiliensis TaxID=1329796 RepID=UPI0005CC6F1F|nr:primosomal protein DnaI [Risungbinella massiliensis]
MNSIQHFTKPDPKAKINRSKQLNLLLQYPAIRSFLAEHPEVTRSQLDRHYHQLMHLVTEQEQCNHCPGLAKCPNMMKGHTPKLMEYAGYLEVRMTPCQKKLREEEWNKQKDLFKSMHIPMDITSSSLDQIDFTKGRAKAIAAAFDFCEQFSQGKLPSKGLFLHGPLGVGKSIIAGSIANKLVENGIDSFMVYVPDFIREVRNSIEDRSLGEKLSLFKSVSLLILDDIGAEYLTPWVRDEVIGAILHYRAANGLPTMYTSNLSLDELEDHLAQGRNTTDEMKAKRIMERIRHFVTPILVEGPNRRI